VGKNRLKVLVLRNVGAVVLLVLTTYAGDYLSIRYRSSRGRDPFATVAVQPYYAIHQKNGKVEYDFAAPENQTCILSLFPHFGYSPCWYLKRHTERRIDI
jgi:hypothetical protein